MTILHRRETRTRAPRQARSKATVEALLEATARILERDGLRALTTARITREAGVGVGSLYEYFESKEAIVRALCQRHLDDVRAVADASFMRLAHADIPTAVEAYIDALYAIQLTRLALQRVLLRELPGRLGAEVIVDINRYLEAKTLEWLEARRQQLRTDDLATLAFVLVRTGRAVTVDSITEGHTPDEIARTRLQLKDMLVRAMVR